MMNSEEGYVEPSQSPFDIDDDKLEAFSEILAGIRNTSDKTIVPILKKIEANTSNLSNLSNLKKSGSVKQAVKTVTAEGKFPRQPSILGRRITANKPESSLPVAIAVKVPKSNTADNKIEKPQAVTITVDKGLPLRNAKGRFVSSRNDQIPIQDATVESGNAPGTKRGRLATMAAFGVHMAKGGFKDKKGTMMEAVGRGALGPAYDAIVEMKDKYDEFKGAKDNLKDEYSKFKGKGDIPVVTASAVKNQESGRDNKGRFQSIVDANSEEETDKIIDALMKSDMSDDDRHKELIKAILKKEEIRKNAKSSFGLPEVKQTGTGSTAREKIRERKNKPQLPTGVAARSSNIPGMREGSNGLFGKLGTMVMRVGPMLAALPLGTIAAGVAAVGAVGAAGYSLFTGKDNIISQFAQALGLVPKVQTDTNGKITGGPVESGRDKKFEQQYQQYAPAVQASAAKYGVPEDYMKTVMKIESNGDKNAVSSTGASGLYQFTKGTATQYGIRGREFDPSANIDAAARLAKDNANQMSRKGIRVNSSNLYLAHQLGVGAVGKGGLSDLLNAAQTGSPVSDALRKQMDVNGGKGKDAKQFLVDWRRKYTDVAMSVGANAVSSQAIEVGKQDKSQPIAATTQIAQKVEPQKSAGATVEGEMSRDKASTAMVESRPKQIATVTIPSPIEEARDKKRTDARAKSAAAGVGSLEATAVEAGAPVQPMATATATGVSKVKQPERINPEDFFKQNFAGPVAANGMNAAGNMATSSIPGMDSLISLMTKVVNEKEARKAGGNDQPLIKTEFDDTMLTLMAYDLV